MKPGVTTASASPSTFGVGKPRLQGRRPCRPRRSSMPSTATAPSRMISRREFIVTTSCPITNNTGSRTGSKNTVQEYDHGERLTNDAQRFVRRQSGAAPLLVPGGPRRRSRRRAGRGRTVARAAGAVARRRRRARRGVRPLPASRVAAVARTRGRRLPAVSLPRLVVRGRRVRACACRRRRPTCRYRPRRASSTVHLDERYGLVWVCLDEPAAPIPEIAQEDDPAFRRINNPVERWHTSATRMTDNFMDIAHFPWVHIGTFGRAQDTFVPQDRPATARRLVLRLPLRGRGQQSRRGRVRPAGRRPTRSPAR